MFSQSISCLFIHGVFWWKVSNFWMKSSQSTLTPWLWRYSRFCSSDRSFISFSFYLEVWSILEKKYLELEIWVYPWLYAGGWISLGYHLLTCSVSNTLCLHQPLFHQHPYNPEKWLRAHKGLHLPSLAPHSLAFSLFLVHSMPSSSIRCVHLLFLLAKTSFPKSPVYCFYLVI